MEASLMNETKSVGKTKPTKRMRVHIKNRLLVAMLVIGIAGTLAAGKRLYTCLLYTSPSPRDGLLSRMPSSA